CSSGHSSFDCDWSSDVCSSDLTRPRGPRAPVAWYEAREGAFELVAKFAGHLWSARIDHSPLDVVAWHGNHAPYRYDLRRFNTMRSEERRVGNAQTPRAANAAQI